MCEFNVACTYGDNLHCVERFRECENDVRFTLGALYLHRVNAAALKDTAALTKQKRHPLDSRTNETYHAAACIEGT